MPAQNNHPMNEETARGVVDSISSTSIPVLRGVPQGALNAELRFSDSEKCTDASVMKTGAPGALQRIWM